MAIEIVNESGAEVDEESLLHLQRERTHGVGRHRQCGEQRGDDEPGSSADHPGEHAHCQWGQDEQQLVSEGFSAHPPGRADPELRSAGMQEPAPAAAEAGDRWCGQPRTEGEQPHGHQQRRGRP